MFIVPITKMDIVSSLEEAGKQSGSKRPEKEFKNILQEAIQTAQEESAKGEEVDKLLATGQIDDLHTALIQAEKSAAAIEFTTQLTSRAVGAYNQIMGMQI
ncbi:flagellar hook-basal body complex protein FliE [Clostridium transplantifaecale]|uniref:flagellar hook-basal body complex protein FliE n=1 Tax=Clostridium transplantifaecale TaxID=2479838 RepID=UPI000F63B36F|nr:flagellar hook-basal body complex protein FliE [Clostridium transplantifaecale]